MQLLPKKTLKGHHKTTRTHLIVLNRGTQYEGMNGCFWMYILSNEEAH